jgi:zinc transporter, ZIP family
LDSLLLRILAFTCLPVAAMILGGLLAVFRPPGPKLGSAIQHFAAGMVFAAGAIELLPDVVSKHAPVATILGFSAGIALMLVIRRVTESAAPRGKVQGQSSIGLIAAVGVDIVIDGLLIGIGFVAGASH